MIFMIIGGGAGGCGTALELANRGYRVVLVERRSELLSGSSEGTPCRLGLGFHYIDINSAKKYLKATIEFLKKYPGFELAKDKERLHPYRRWRYFVAKNSQFSLEQTEEVFATLKNEYSRLIAENPANKVLGEVKDFYRRLDKNEYQEQINSEQVIAGFETAEQVLNWPAFKQHLLSEIEHHPNITVYRNLEVVKVAHSARHAGFELQAKKAGMQQVMEMSADFIINCAWENIEAINQQLGFTIAPDSRTNRLKVIVQIKLPAHFECRGPAHSMFFCFGPHCSFTNLGDGTGFISYEPVTNIEISTELHSSELSQKLLYSKVSEEEIERYGQRILEGVVKYIPGLAGAKTIAAKFGIVKTKGTVNIFSAKSDFHRRDYSGVEARQLRLIDNACMKLLYLFENAKEVAALVEQHLELDKEIHTVIASLPIKKEHGVFFALIKDLQKKLVLENVTQRSAIKTAVYEALQATLNINLQKDFSGGSTGTLEATCI